MVWDVKSRSRTLPINISSPKVRLFLFLFRLCHDVPRGATGGDFSNVKRQVCLCVVSIGGPNMH